MRRTATRSATAPRGRSASSTNIDELYWNVTGNGWDFPIDEARVMIRLPRAPTSSSMRNITGGYRRDASNDARVLSAEGNVFEAETTRRSSPSEGFTVAVAWQKGIVAPPSDCAEMGLVDLRQCRLLRAGAGASRLRPLFPLRLEQGGARPAEGHHHSALRAAQGAGALPPCAIVTRYGVDDKGFAAAMVGLAVKGRLKIADDDDRPSPSPSLPSPQGAAADTGRSARSTRRCPRAARS